MTALTLVTTSAESDPARWEQWRPHYTDSSRRTTPHTHLVFGVVLFTVAAVLVRALPS